MKKKITKFVKNRNVHAKATLFAGMYAITATIITLETNLITGLTLGLVGSSMKTVWAVVHSKIFK